MALCNICNEWCPMSEDICEDCYFGRKKRGDNRYCQSCDEYDISEIKVIKILKYEKLESKDVK